MFKTLSVFGVITHGFVLQSQEMVGKAVDLILPIGGKIFELGWHLIDLNKLASWDIKLRWGLQRHIEHNAASQMQIVHLWVSSFVVQQH